MGNTCGHEHCSPGADLLCSICVPKCQFTVENVPAFVIGMMHVKDSRAATSPLMDFKRFPAGGERIMFHCRIILRSSGQGLPNRRCAGLQSKRLVGHILSEIRIFHQPTRSLL
jgi:hypothetical protein